MSILIKDLDKLLKKYNINNTNISSDIINLLEEKNKNKKNNKKINKNEQCIAKVKNGQQCSRRKKDSNYCGIHQHRFKFNINEPTEKQNYIETWVDEELGPDYLIDSNNYVYTYNIQSPIIIGIKSPNGKIKPFNLIEKNDSYL